MKNIIRVTTLATLLVLCTIGTQSNATVPVAFQDDNGNASFVRQVVPKLLGQKPRGTLEIKLLTDIANLRGREAVVRLLMEQPQFISHWGALLTDHMKLQRALPEDKYSIGLRDNREQSPECYESVSSIGGAAGFTPDNKIELAEFVRDSAINMAYSKEFNMHELIESSLYLDNLFPAYRGYLFTMGSHPNNVGSMRTAEQQRAEVGSAFDDVFLNRNFQCLSCHRGTYSTTGIGARTHPLYKTIDAAVFDHNGLDANEPAIINNTTYQMNCGGCHGNNGTNGTATYPEGGIVSVLDASASQIQNAINQGETMKDQSYLKDLSYTQLEVIAAWLVSSSSLGKANISETARKHYSVFRSDYFAVDNPEEGDGPWNMSTTCASIVGHVSDAIPAFVSGVESDNLTMRELDELLHSGYKDSWLTDVFVSGLESLDESNSMPGDVALAYMLAAKITDNVWEQLMGSRLTIVNQFARNSWQRNLHKQLTEDVFIANDWSLKELIVSILTKSFFNRQAPASSMASSIYALQPIFDPFIVADQPCIYDDYVGDGNVESQIATPVEGECAFNGQGELVHRYSARTLLTSVGSAMGWAKPKIFESSSYPSKRFTADVGQYISEYNTGDSNVTFQSMLSWDEQLGICQNKNGKADDWLNRLVNGVDGYNAVNPDAPLTWRDLVYSLKDWLIQEPVFGGYDTFKLYETGTSSLDEDAEEDPLSKLKSTGATVEEQLVNAVLEEYQSGFTSLDKEISSNEINESGLRQLCGVYLKSPQFMLAGLIRSDVFEAPRYRVCNGGVCTYEQMCGSYEHTLEDLGYPVACLSDSVVQPFAYLPGRESTTKKKPDPTPTSSQLDMDHSNEEESSSLLNLFNIFTRE